MSAAPSRSAAEYAAAAAAAATAYVLSAAKPVDGQHDAARRTAAALILTAAGYTAATAAVVSGSSRNSPCSPGHQVIPPGRSIRLAAVPQSPVAVEPAPAMAAAGTPLAQCTRSIMSPLPTMIASPLPADDAAYQRQCVWSRHPTNRASAPVSAPTTVCEGTLRSARRC